MPNSNLSERLASELRAEMARQQISMLQASRDTGLPYGVLRRIVQGKRSMTVDECALLCRFLNVSLRKVLTPTREPAA